MSSQPANSHNFGFESVFHLIACARRGARIRFSPQESINWINKGFIECTEHPLLHGNHIQSILSAINLYFIRRNSFAFHKIDGCVSANKFFTRTEWSSAIASSANSSFVSIFRLFSAVFLDFDFFPVQNYVFHCQFGIKQFSVGEI